MDAPNKNFFDAAFSSQELAEILQRIDDNLTWRSEAVKKDEAGLFVNYVYPPPQLVVADISAQVEENTMYNAPFFVVKGWGAASLLKRFLNFVLKIFAGKQAYLNKQELQMLHTLNQNTLQLTAIAEYQLQSYHALVTLKEAVSALEAEQIKLKDEIKKNTRAPSQNPGVDE